MLRRALHVVLLPVTRFPFKIATRSSSWTHLPPSPLVLVAKPRPPEHSFPIPCAPCVATQPVERVASPTSKTAPTPAHSFGHDNAHVEFWNALTATQYALFQSLDHRANALKTT